MHFTGEVYRHPIEADTPLLQVTIGCSHNKCSFCTMYRNTPFGVSPQDHIDEDLQELKATGRNITRIFLVNGEPFVLSTARLIEIGEKINKYFPNIEAITCYTSIQNLKKKSVEELKQLRALNFNQLHIGLESADDEALAIMNKGFTSEEAYENLEKLQQAGIEWDAIVMTGVAGKNRGVEHIEKTAELINTYPPYLISLMTTSVSSGSELEQYRNEGRFVECTEREKIEEEKLLLQLVNVEDAYFFGSHYYNLIPVSGELKHKEAIIEYIDRKMAQISDAVLDSVQPRANI